MLPAAALIGIPLCIESDFTPGSGTAAYAGMIMGGAGLVLMVISVGTMVRFGRGTLAPWAPAEHLVTQGIYSKVRNPMITGAVMILVGEALVFQSIPIALWALLFFITNTVYIRYVEEPILCRRFPGIYAQYAQRVPRWIPRFRQS